MMKLKYHALVCQFFSITPTLDVKAADAIAKAEAKAGRRIPASIREFYSIAGLAERMNEDELVIGVQPLGYVLKWFTKEAMKTKPRWALNVVYWSVNPGELKLEVSFSRAADPKTEGITGRQWIPFSELVREAAWINVVFTSCRVETGKDIAAWVEVGPPHCDFVAEDCTPFRNYYTSSGINPLNGSPYGDCYTYQAIHPLGCIQLVAKTDPHVSFTTGYWQLYARTPEKLLQLYELFRPIHGHPVNLSPRDDKKLRKLFEKHCPDLLR